MSAKHYFPDSFSCRCSQILPIRSTTSAPTQGSLSGCSGGASGVYDDDDGDDDIREGGGSDAGGGFPPSLSLSPAVTTVTDLPTTLPFKMTLIKNVTLPE